MLYLMKFLMVMLAVFGMVGSVSAGRPASPGNSGNAGNGRSYPFQVRGRGAYQLPDGVDSMYGCIFVDASEITSDMWATSVNVQQTANEKIGHHSVFYGVRAGSVMDQPGNGCPSGDPWNPNEDCMVGAASRYNFGDVIENCYLSRSSAINQAEVLFATQRGNPDFVAPEGYGIPVGPQTEFKYFLWQMHFERPMNRQNGTVSDNTGAILKLTSEPKTNLGIMYTGNIVHRSIQLPNGHEGLVLRQEITGDSGCKDTDGFDYPCVKRNVPALGGDVTLGRFGMFEQFVTRSSIVANGGIDIHASGIHFHHTGRSGRVDIVRNLGGGVKQAELLDFYQTPGGHDAHVPNYHPFSPPVHMNIGDGLDFNATYSTVNVHAHPGAHQHVHGGFESAEEMFLAFMIYSPAEPLSSTIRAFSPCTYCNLKTDESLNLLAGHEAIPEEVVTSQYGTTYYCHPNGYQALVRQSPGLCPTECKTEAVICQLDPTACFCPA